VNFKNLNSRFYDQRRVSVCKALLLLGKHYTLSLWPTFRLADSHWLISVYACAVQYQIAQSFVITRDFFVVCNFAWGLRNLHGVSGSASEIGSTCTTTASCASTTTSSSERHSRRPLGSRHRRRPPRRSRSRRGRASTPPERRHHRLVLRPPPHRWNGTLSCSNCINISNSSSIYILIRRINTRPRWTAVSTGRPKDMRTSKRGIHRVARNFVGGGLRVEATRSRRRRSRGKGCGEGCSPPQPTRGLGECRKLPSGVRGRARPKTIFFSAFRARKKHIW